MFHDYDKCTITMSIASESPRWCTKAFLKYCFEYAFDHLKAHRISTFVRVDNLKSFNITKRIGFDVECELKENQKDEDGEIYNTFVFRMFREDCKWVAKAAKAAV